MDTEIAGADFVTEIDGTWVILMSILLMFVIVISLIDDVAAIETVERDEFAALEQEYQEAQDGLASISRRLEVAKSDLEIERNHGIGLATDLELAESSVSQFEADMTQLELDLSNNEVDRIAADKRSAELDEHLSSAEKTIAERDEDLGRSNSVLAAAESDRDQARESLEIVEAEKMTLDEEAEEIRSNLRQVQSTLASAQELLGKSGMGSDAVERFAAVREEVSTLVAAKGEFEAESLERSVVGKSYSVETTRSDIIADLALSAGLVLTEVELPTMALIEARADGLIAQALAAYATEQQRLDDAEEKEKRVAAVLDHVRVNIAPETTIELSNFSAGWFKTSQIAESTMTNIVDGWLSEFDGDIEGIENEIMDGLADDAFAAYKFNSDRVEAAYIALESEVGEIEDAIVKSQQLHLQTSNQVEDMIRGRLGSTSDLVADDVDRIVSASARDVVRSASIANEKRVLTAQNLVQLTLWTKLTERGTDLSSASGIAVELRKLIAEQLGTVNDATVEEVVATHAQKLAETYQKRQGGGLATASANVDLVIEVAGSSNRTTVRVLEGSELIQEFSTDQTENIGERVLAIAANRLIEQLSTASEAKMVVLTKVQSSTRYGIVAGIRTELIRRISEEPAVELIWSDQLDAESSLY